MLDTLIQMAALIACGVVWRIAKPADLRAEQTRFVLTGLVYYLLLPALVLSVLWRAEIGLHSLRFTALGISCIAFGIVTVGAVSRFISIPDAKLGSLMLAAAFSNVTYMGLPVLEQTFGPWARSVAVQLDLFASAPLVLTLGIMIARHYGEDRETKGRLLWSLFRVPSIWAAVIAVFLNRMELAIPVWLDAFLDELSAGVVPLMLISLGLGLRWDALHWRNVPFIIPVMVVKMLLLPLFGTGIALQVGLEGETFVAAVLEMAMPCMVLGIVFCDRYRLDSGLFAMAVTLTTILSMVTLPLWYRWLQAWA